MDRTSNDIATQLYEDIVIGAFSFGNKLVEERLAKAYGTKRHILREAFGQLEEIGFVERIPNRGVYVRKPDPKEVRELYKLRALLETHATREMPLPAPKETTDELRRIQDRHSAAIRGLNFREVLHLNTEFHRVQYSSCQNDTLVAAIEYYATRTHLITASKFSDAAVMENVIAQHEAIIAAMKGHDHAVLAACVQNHFDMDRVDQYEREHNLRHEHQGAVPGQQTAALGRVWVTR
ncbi:MAG: GntR family transcriptional regulator [Stappiaceae bacterium]